MPTCQSYLLAATRALVDGVVAEDPHVCMAPVSFQVVCKLAPGFEAAADVCTGHQQLIEATLPGTRSVAKYSRT
jgi:hypothetical protein